MPSRKSARFWLIVLAVLLIGAAAGGAAYKAVKQKKQTQEKAIALTGGDPDHGSKLLVRYGCAGCHTIPGVPRANGLVGPSLQHIASRVYIGGVLLNNPDNLMRWLKNPPGVDPMTAMPATGLSDRDARDIAAYLYTLR